MLEVERIVDAIYREYRIRLDHNYVERIKRLICGPLCGGKCNESYIIKIGKEKL